MGSFLHSLMMMSVSGSIMYIAAELLYKHTNAKSASWYYAMLVTSAMLFLIPLSGIFSIPKLYTVTFPESRIFTEVGAVPSVSAAGGAPLKISLGTALAAVWSAGAAVFCGKLIYEYLHTRIRLIRASAPAFDPQLSCVCREVSAKLKIKRRLNIRTSPCIKTPLLFGIIFPTIIIPEKKFKERELMLIFRHELTHMRHMDLPIKLCTSVICVLHWFNPLAYRLRGAVNTACELCCDESVLKDADKAYKKLYGSLLLSVMERSEKSVISHTTAMALPKESIKHRLTKIIEFKRMSLPARIAAAMSAMSVAVCSVTAFGFETAANVLPDSLMDAVYDSGAKTDPAYGIITEPLYSADTHPTDVRNTAAPLASYTPPAVPDYEIDVHTPPAEDMYITEQPGDEFGTAIPGETDIPAAPDVRSEENADEIFYSGDSENNESSVQAAAAAPEGSFVPSIPDDSYVFDYNFADTGLDAMENRFTASEDCVACIYRGYADPADIAVYDITDNNRLIFDTSQDTVRSFSNIYVSLKQGHEYILKAFGTESNTNIYIYSETRDYFLETYKPFE